VVGVAKQIVQNPFAMAGPAEISSLTLNRLSLYLRCLRKLQESGATHVSSSQLAQQFDLSAPLIRKDLAQFGEFGIRGTGYRVDDLAESLNKLLGLDRAHNLAVVGMGSLGSALARYLSVNDKPFRIVAAFDVDGRKVGHKIGHLVIHHSRDIPTIIPQAGAQIAVLTVPASTAQRCYDDLAASGIKAVLNFAPTQLKQKSTVRTKSVDFQINLEELAYFLSS
jgi:redox-sensing transcriptional repressor